jgi:hypothetical protein
MAVRNDLLQLTTVPVPMAGGTGVPPSVIASLRGTEN